MCAIYIFGLININQDENDSKAVPILQQLHVCLFWTSICLLPFIIPPYILSVFMNPGKIEKKYSYVSIIDKALENQIPLENFCSYD